MKHTKSTHQHIPAFITFLILLLLILLSAAFSGCQYVNRTVDHAVEQTEADKQQCSLNHQDLTQMTCGKANFTITAQTITEDDLGAWTGKIHEFAAISPDGSVITTQSPTSTLERITTPAQLLEDSPEADYVVWFGNVFDLKSDAQKKVVDAGEGFYLAIPHDKVTENTPVFNPRQVEGITTADVNSSTAKDFFINPNNATELIAQGKTFVVTNQKVPEEDIETLISTLGKSIIYQADTKQPLSKEELNRIYWGGGPVPNRIMVSYGSVFSISGHPGTVRETVDLGLA